MCSEYKIWDGQFSQQSFCCHIKVQVRLLAIIGQVVMCSEYGIWVWLFSQQSFCCHIEVRVRLLAIIVHLGMTCFTRICLLRGVGRIGSWSPLHCFWS